MLVTESAATTVPVAARLPEPLAKDLAALAAAGDRTISREIRRAVREHVLKSTEREPDGARAS